MEKLASFKVNKKIVHSWKQYSTIKPFFSLSWTRSSFYFSWIWLSQDFVSLKAQVDFIIEEVPSNFWVLHLSNPPYVIPPRKTKVHNYVVSIFGFANRYMASKYDNVILFQQWTLGFEKIKSYLDDFNHKIHSKWAIANRLHCTSPKFRFKKVFSHLKPNLDFKISFQIIC
jgi:hypothetical protein